MNPCIVLMEEDFLLRQMRTFISLKCCWNGPIKLRSNRHWSFASTEDNRYELYCVHPKKTMWSCGHHFSGWLYDLRLLWSWFTVRSIVLTFLRLGCEVMNSCFVHSNESTEKFIWITLKHLQTSPNLFWNCHMIVLMVHSEQTWHPFCR